MPKKQRSKVSLNIIAECKSIIVNQFPLTSKLKHKDVAGYWIPEEDLVILGDLSCDEYWERNLIFALLILESEGA